MEVNSCSENCHDTVGSYTCSCNAGYTLNSNGFTCDGMLSFECVVKLVSSYIYTNSADINECSSNTTNSCEHACVNTLGLYTCSCNSGYVLNSDGQTCRGQQCTALHHDVFIVCMSRVSGIMLFLYNEFYLGGMLPICHEVHEYSYMG